MKLNLFLKPGDLVFSRKHKRQGRVVRVTKTCAFVVFGSYITPAWCSKKQLTRVPNFRRSIYRIKKMLTTIFG